MGEITLRQSLDDYENIYLAARNYAQRSRVEYMNDVRDLIQFLEQFGMKKVGEIGLPYLERYKAELDQRGIAGSTRKRKVVSIRSFLGYLYQDQFLSTNLAKQLIPPFVEAKSPRYLTKSEYERLLAECTSNSRDFAFIQLMLQTGIKLSEITQLTINDFELPSVLASEMKDVGYIHIRGSERRKGRILPLNYKACLALDAYLRKRTQFKITALFVNRFGKQLGPRGLEKIVKKYFLKAGIINANVQSLRHTFAIHHVINGTNVETIQEMMGFKDSRSLARYALLSRELKNAELQNNSL